MTNEERIASHLRMIKRFQSDIQWIEDNALSIGPGHTGMVPNNTQELVQRELDNIKLYEFFIARLKGPKR